MINGPRSGQPLYLPITGPLDKNRDEVIGDKSELVPIWLVWVALGCGGRQLLNKPVPKGVTMIDAVTDPRVRAQSTSAPAALAGPCNSTRADDSKSTASSRAKARGALKVVTACVSVTLSLPQFLSLSLCLFLFVLSVTVILCVCTLVRYQCIYR